MAMGNMEWIRLAATGGRDPNVRLASTGEVAPLASAPSQDGARSGSGPATASVNGQQPATPPGTGQTTTSPNEVKQTLVLCVDQYNHSMEGSVIRFQILGGGGYKIGGLKPNEGEVEAANVPVPKSKGFIKVWADLEDEEVAGGCKLEPNEDGVIYVKIAPVAHDRTVARQTTTGQTSQGNQVTVGASVSATVAGHVPFVADGSLTGTGSVQNQFARNDTSSSTQEMVTEAFPVVTGLIVTATADRPSTMSGLTGPANSFG